MVLLLIRRSGQHSTGRSGNELQQSGEHLLASGRFHARAAQLVPRSREHCLQVITPELGLELGRCGFLCFPPALALADGPGMMLPVGHMTG